MIVAMSAIGTKQTSAGALQCPLSGEADMVITPQNVRF